MEHEASKLPEFAWVPSPEVAEAGVRGLERGRGVVIPGKLNKVTALSGHLTPRSLWLGIGRRLYRTGDSQ